MLAILIAALLASLLLTGCGGNGSTRSPKRAPDLGVVTNGGRLVDIGGGRSLYLNCVGSGSPTVILEAGFGGTTNNWSAVQPQLGRTVRTCAYDRAGLGNSLPIPGVHDAGDEIADLEALLDHARIAPPYVLVGHSYGGLLARLFARAHPGETAGVVLVDAMGRDQDRRFLGTWRRLPASVRAGLPKPAAEPVVDGVDIRAGEALDAKGGTLPAVPLAVITRGVADDEVPRRARPAVEAVWTRMQDQLAAMSPDHVHVVALRSGHFVQSYAGGQPGVVIRAVRAVTDAARGDASLPDCTRIFTGAGTRCRG
jgi:pimeloyl-ACP methyl ester carboxylesterase